MGPYCPECQAAGLDPQSGERVTIDEVKSVLATVRGWTVPGSAVSSWQDLRSALLDFALHVVDAEQRDARIGVRAELAVGPTTPSASSTHHSDGPVMGETFYCDGSCKRDSQRAAAQDDARGERDR